MDEGSALWYNLAQPPSVGLAAPVERLLQQLHAEPVVLKTVRAIEEEE
jgi:A/G-specific adenine glycosylase